MPTERLLDGRLEQNIRLPAQKVASPKLMRPGVYT
jgi:hypothetical protein